MNVFQYTIILNGNTTESIDQKGMENCVRTSLLEIIQISINYPNTKSNKYEAKTIEFT